MNLSYPFESAQDVKPDAFGRIALVDGDGKVLAHLPLASAYGIAPELSGRGAGLVYGMGYGDGYGFSFGGGEGMGYGDGYGDGGSSGYGEGGEE